MSAFIGIRIDRCIGAREPIGFRIASAKADDNSLGVRRGLGETGESLENPFPGRVAGSDDVLDVSGPTNDASFPAVDLDPDGTPLDD